MKLNPNQVLLKPKNFLFKQILPNFQIWERQKQGFCYQLNGVKKGKSQCKKR